MKAVKVCSGSSFVRGWARKYPYFIARLFEGHRREDGVWTYRPTKIYVGPYRSQAKAEREGRKLATEENAAFVEGYGSLSDTPVPQPVVEKQECRGVLG